MCLCALLVALHLLRLRRRRLRRAGGGHVEAQGVARARPHREQRGRDELVRPRLDVGEALNTHGSKLVDSLVRLRANVVLEKSFDTTEEIEIPWDIDCTIPEPEDEATHPATGTGDGCGRIVISGPEDLETGGDDNDDNAYF